MTRYIIFFLLYIMLKWNVCIAEENQKHNHTLTTLRNEEGTAAQNSTEKSVEETAVPTNIESSEQIINGTLTNPPTFIGQFNSEAMMRGFYVFIGIGAIVLVYIAVKTFRMRRHRAVSRYKVISKGEDAESFFPLAAEEEEDEEIYSASNRQTYS